MDNIFVLPVDFTNFSETFLKNRFKNTFSNKDIAMQVAKDLTAQYGCSFQVLEKVAHTEITIVAKQ